MKNWKRTLSALLTIAMIATLLVIPAAAEVAETPAVVDAPVSSGAAVTLGETIAEARSSRDTREVATLLAGQTFKPSADTTVDSTAGEAQITTGIDGLELWAGKDSSHVWKTDNTGTYGNLGYEGYYIGNDAVKKGETVLDAPADGATTFDIPDSGAYYKIKLTDDGALTVHVLIPSTGKYFYALKSDGTSIHSLTGTAPSSKSVETVTVAQGKSGDVYYIFLTKSKIGLLDVSFVSATAEPEPEEVVPAGAHKITAAQIEGATDNTSVTQDQLNSMTKAGEGATAAGFFTPASSDLKYRSTPALEVGKSGAGGLKFVVPAGKKAKVTAELASTGSTNVTDFVLYTVTGGKVIVPEAAADGDLTDGSSISDAGVVTVKSTTASKVVWDGALPGTYYVGTDKAFSARGGRILSVQVEESDWDGTVNEANATEAQIKGENPQISDVTNEGDGKITAKVTGPRVGIVETVSTDSKTYTYTKYADKVVLKLYDKDNSAVIMDGEKEIAAESTVDGTEHSFTLSPKASGIYTLKAFANSDIQVTSYTTAISFVLPLAKPAPVATAKAGNAIEVKWSAVAEATGYNIYMSTDKNDKGETPVVANTTETTYTAEALTEGTTYFFWVEAIRGEETVLSDVTMDTAVATPVEWTGAVFGTNGSSKAGSFAKVLGDNGKIGVRVTASGTKFQTKLQGEGLSFYYTKVPISAERDQNFTLEATMKVNSWDEDNSQVAFGLMAADYVQKNGDTTDYFSNEIFVGAAECPKSARKNGVFAGRVGISAWYKHGGTDKKGTGLTYECTNLDPWVLNYGDQIDPLLTYYTPIGNKRSTSKTTGVYAGTKNDDGTWTGITELHLRLQRNNTGYFLWYMDADGLILNPGGKALKIYDRDCLNTVDPDNIYVGLMAARKADVTFNDIIFYTSDPATDAPAEEKEYEPYVPTLTLASATDTNHADYHAVFTSNVRGTLNWSLGSQKGTVEVTDITSEVPNPSMTGVLRADADMTIQKGNNLLKMSFTPYPEEQQTDLLKDDEKITTFETVELSKTIVWSTTYEDRNNIYVSPSAGAYGNGTRSKPMSIYKAVTVVQPGQKILMLPGTYLMNTTLVLPQGMDGLEDAPVYLMADPESVDAETGEVLRPVLDFQEKVAGISVRCNYWYLKGFDVTKCNGTGIAVGGSNNVFDSLNIYRGTASGMQISRIGATNAAIEFWPSNNLVYRCVAFLNRDGGQTAADGFAHKETCGYGNVFRDCVSAYNSDDGWDFYAKPAQGSIGEATIDHCYSYRNGWIENSDGTLTSGAGGGNGFKMGGDNVPTAKRAGHTATNSFSFFNKAYGYTSNSCPDINLLNVVGYKNATNYNLYTGGTAGTNFVINGFLTTGGSDNASKGSAATVGAGNSTKNVKTVTDSAYVNTKFANPMEKDYTESASAVIDPIDTTTNTVRRNADGFVDFGDFLALADTSLASIYPAPEAVEYPFTLSAAQIKDALENITADVIDSNTSSGNSSIRDDSGRGGSSAGTTDTTDTTDTTGSTDTSVVETKVETREDGTEVTTKTMADGNVAVTEVSPEGDVTIAVTNPDGEKVVDIQLPTEIPAAETKFSDVPDDHWAAAAIDRMTSLGMVNGVGDGIYDMEAQVTRGTIATMLFRFANGAEGKTSAFTDVAAGSWYADAIGWAAASGVVTGYSETEFGPNDTITREQLAVMLVRFAKIIGMDTTVSGDLGSFGDAGSVSGWATDAVTWCVEKGIINGVSADTLSPATTATRAQTAVMLDRFIGKMK